jgi:hypothetical protein
MISRTSIVAILVLGSAATGLYQLKYDVAALEERAQALTALLDSERQALHVLNAEWAYLNKPERLAELAERHLDLVPLVADQIIPLEAIPRRAPPQRQIAEAGSGTAAPDDGADR